MRRFFFVLTALAVALNGCKKLDQIPQDTATKEAVFGSEKGLELYANSFYKLLPSASDAHKKDEMSDYAARSQAPDFLVNGAYGPRQSNGWDWDGLRNINYFLENNNNNKVSAAVRLQYNALARFFRAYFYYTKVRRFGDVPWINKTFKVDDPDLYKGRDKRSLVMDSVLADLNYACNNISRISDNSRSLITKYVALGFKSRVCLYEGTYRKYHDEAGLTGSSEQWLRESADAAQKVMTEGGFALNTSGGDLAYRNLFISTTPVATEVMLAAVTDANLSVYNDANWWWTSATYGARISFTRMFINTYLNIDGTPFTNRAGYQTLVFKDEVKGRDKRLQQTIRMGDYKRINGGALEAAPPIFSYTYTGYQPIKYVLDDTKYDGGGQNINSIPLMRYAEILLNYAEAKAELGTFTDADWIKTVGSLRQRAGITGGLSNKPATADPYLQTVYFPGISDAALLEIRRERGIELSLEGLRFDDIVRWKKGDLMTKVWNGFYVPALNVPMDLNDDGKPDVCFYQVMPANPVAGVNYINVAPTINGGPNPQRLSNDTSGELTWLSTTKRVFEQKNYLYPIPESDRLFNPKLGQNPGW
ncbi:RagB/SusD family nutrient uptake outer membrane protein [Pedobacter sp. HMWF019]|uniref:RagB/SusD family nutrient uptake outer membrane protein n=1 Tax=Pedobacter sp. HMWF019 TaxID=2056856 RepID=UPI000D3349C7|nr:RagB/SusD family nutrient uptake outer membrane protein [Pedobacter sp. HMWF019]PTT04200.1 RagB/SusD family nutrient uptake outer membrane protein [Pedobacter sp. HMWF019]